VKKNEFLCTYPLYYKGKWYKVGDKILIKEKKPKPAPIYICLQPYEYKGVKYRGGEMGYFSDEFPPSDFFVPILDFDKYKPTFYPFDKVIYVRKEE